jgi:hypothetical protein
MKAAFQRLVAVPPYEVEDDEDVDVMGLMEGEDDDLQNVSEEADQIIRGAELE